MWPVARIGYGDAKTQFVVVDNYTLQPIQLTAVKMQKDHRASKNGGELVWPPSSGGSSRRRPMKPSQIAHASRDHSRWTAAVTPTTSGMPLVTAPRR